mgnify:CR=1 FL=1
MTKRVLCEVVRNLSARHFCFQSLGDGGNLVRVTAGACRLSCRVSRCLFRGRIAERCWPSPGRAYNALQLPPHLSRCRESAERPHRLPVSGIERCRADRRPGDRHRLHQVVGARLHTQDVFIHGYGDDFEEVLWLDIAMHNAAVITTPSCREVTEFHWLEIVALACLPKAIAALPIVSNRSSVLGPRSVSNTTRPPNARRCTDNRTASSFVIVMIGLHLTVQFRAVGRIAGTARGTLPETAENPFEKPRFCRRIA